MNHLIIIGNVTRDPSTRYVQTAKGQKLVCNFTVAVNNRKTEDAQFFRVTAWDRLAELCRDFTGKGKKVCVTGSVSARVYTPEGGEARAEIDVMAHEVEFLSPREALQRVDSEEADLVFTPKTGLPVPEKQMTMDADLPF